MDMKRILQAFDNASTKPVEGASDMSKFLRIVSENNINQPTPQQDPNFQKYCDLMARYDMLSAEMTPDNSGIEKNASPEFIQQVNAMKAQASQLAGPNLQAWEQARKAGSAPQQSQQQLATQLEDTVFEAGEPADPNFQRYADLMAKYDLLAKELLPDNSGIEKGASPDAIAEINKIKAMAAQVAGQNLQAWEQARQASNSASMAQAQANQPALAQQLEEGANPHGVSLAVQMAMSHYQQPKTVTPKRTSLLKQYFAEAEEQVAQEEQERKEHLKMYAQNIASRVLMKESKEITEAPIAPTDDPNNPMIYGHEKANPMELKTRILRARAQLRELAEKAESNDLIVWENIGKLFPELAMNIEQVRHGIHELAALRRKGGTSSRGINKMIGERSVSQAQAHMMAAAAHNPEFARKVKIKQSVAKEFNKADKGKNIKSLPTRVPKKK